MAHDNTLDAGNGLIRGDQFSRYFYFTGLSSSRYLSKAYLTVKEDAASDADASAIFQKAVTTTGDVDEGQIEDTGESSGIGKVRFWISKENTEAMEAEVRYAFDVQIHLSTGEILTRVSGTAVAAEQITRAQS